VSSPQTDLALNGSGQICSIRCVVQDSSVTDGLHSEVERVWREAGPVLWRALVAYAGDRDVASDAMAEAFAQALRRGDVIRDHERWIWAASFRIAAGELRRRSMTWGPDRSEPAASDLPAPVIDLVRALRTLSPNQRAAAVLHYYADRSTADVASILGCSQTTVRAHLFQARRRLRSLLEDDDD
jgi:RNA polymerase sigma-70 factor (ECF subfamily)